MAGFVYFVEKQIKSIDLEGVQALGLGYAFDGGIECSEAFGPGPCGLARGLFFAAVDRVGKRTGHFPDEQDWRLLPPVADQPKCAIGFWPAEPPTPEILQRPRMLSGLLVTLNGKQWQIPTVRKFDEMNREWVCDLPRLFDYNGNGELIPGKPLKQHAYLWDITAPVASELFEAQDSGEVPKVSDEDVAECAIALIGANYFVAVPELVMMETLVDDGGQSMGLVVSAACMKDSLVEWIDDLKKKDDDPPAQPSLITTDGNAA